MVSNLYVLFYFSPNILPPSSADILIFSIPYLFSPHFLSFPFLFLLTSLMLNLHMALLFAFFLLPFLFLLLLLCLDDPIFVTMLFLSTYFYPFVLYLLFPIPSFHILFLFHPPLYILSHILLLLSSFSLYIFLSLLFSHFHLHFPYFLLSLFFHLFLPFHFYFL